LTAAIPTKLGGDIDYLPREMVFEFLRPVYVGDAIRCEMTLDEVVQEEGKTRLAMSGSCPNQSGKEVPGASFPTEIGTSAPSGESSTSELREVVGAKLAEPAVGGVSDDRA
jgi:hypothetical protein